MEIIIKKKTNKEKGRLVFLLYSLWSQWNSNHFEVQYHRSKELEPMKREHQELHEDTLAETMKLALHHHGICI